MIDYHAIAIVGDDEAGQHSVAGLLRSAGYRIDSYITGTLFLASQIPKTLGCVLLNMREPGLDGLSVMRALQERATSVPILVMIGHGDVRLAAEAMRLGAIDFLEKPYAPGQLLEAIRHACSLSVGRGHST